MGKENKLIKTLIFILLFLVAGKAKAAIETTDTLEAFTIHKNNLDPITVYDDINGKIVAKIYPNQPETTGHIFKILENKNGWFRIDLNLTNVHSWVKAGTLAINSKNYDQAVLTLLEKPSAKSNVVYNTTIEATLLLIDISNEWLKVQLRNKSGKIYLGWIKKEMACGNPYTTCN